MNVLVINAGSSSFKYQLIDMSNEEILAKGLVERIGAEGGPANHAIAISEVVENLGKPVNAIGHRVVHGGEYFSQSVLINDEVINKVKDCIQLAPLHNPVNIMGIDACKQTLPEVPQVAVFDTAFHQTMPKASYIYAIPKEYYDKYKIRRYGFHGTSHNYISQKVAETLGEDIKNLKIITCHLGNGSSISAVDHGKCVNTSMGLTPLGGIPMGTRSGDLDPGVVNFIQEKTGKSSSEIINVLNKQSGVLGISGVSNDYRDIGKAAKEGNKDAQLALNIFANSVKKHIGQYMAEMNGADVIVFAGGVGENDIEMRKRILSNMEFLGINLDDDKNNIRGQIAEISSNNSKVKAYIVPTNEELMIARETENIIKSLEA